MEKSWNISYYIDEHRLNAEVFINIPECLRKCAA